MHINRPEPLPSTKEIRPAHTCAHIYTIIRQKTRTLSKLSARKVLEKYIAATDINSVSIKEKVHSKQKQKENKGMWKYRASLDEWSILVFFGEKRTERKLER